MLVVFVAQAESEAQQKLGELHCQVDKLHTRLYEADVNEQKFKAKLDNAEHEVCGSGFISTENLCCQVFCCVTTTGPTQTVAVTTILFMM